MREPDNIRPLETVGDIWKLHSKQKTAVLVIPTNGTIKNNEQAVMGRGLAADAVKRYLTIDYQLGEKLAKEGNHVFYFKKLRVITFPVKYEWYEMADLSLIQQSTQELQRCILTNKLAQVLVPRVGCGNGGLTWDKVKPVLQEILDHRCTLVSYRKELA